MKVHSLVPLQETYCHCVLRVNPPRATFLRKCNIPDQSLKLLEKSESRKSPIQEFLQIEQLLTKHQQNKYYAYGDFDNYMQT